MSYLLAKLLLLAAVICSAVGIAHAETRTILATIPLILGAIVFATIGRRYRDYRGG